MPKIAVVTSSPPKTEGGHLVIGRALTQALREVGHDAALIVTPDYGFGRNASTYWANRQTSLGAIDQVISLRYPSYAVTHRPHVCWLNHTARDYYDLWPIFSASLSPLNLVKERVRRFALHAADQWLLRTNVDRVMVLSATVQRRLTSGLGISSEVLWPPAPQRPYRCDGYGDYVLAVSRLVPLKRVDLLIRALAEPAASHVRAVIAGEGECRQELESLASAAGVAARVSFIGRLGDAELLDHLARCRAVWFAPYDEDYGFVTVEAFASSKAVITCRDSGGPTELVVDGDNGFIVEPTATAVAVALARVTDDRSCAERMGQNGKTRSDAISWTDAVRRLVIV